MLSQLFQGWLSRNVAQDGSGGRISLEKQKEKCCVSPRVVAQTLTQAEDITDFFQLFQGGAKPGFSLFWEKGSGFEAECAEVQDKSL